MMELLSPAGSPEAVVAAVQNGADAIYLGCGSFNARRNAANFTAEDLKTAVDYCHLRGVRVYLTMNTLLYNRELEPASQLVRYADTIGVDAILVQDLGVLRMIRSTAPDIQVHASTQMTIHNLDGIHMAADLGITRAVLSRELSRDQIAHLCAHSPIELEVFVHGALCMCYSGQCFFSSVIGGRSGNRGLCAQPCRLKYGWDGKASKELLSLKDLQLVEYLSELEALGVACAKIEGRMKRPEYVAIVTKIYADVLHRHTPPTGEELRLLEAAFSRQGFTQGYYLNKKGPGMFGVHRENAVDPTPMFKAVKAEYQRGEHCKTPVTITANLQAGQPISIVAEDFVGHRTTLTGPVPQPAINREITTTDVIRQLSKSGGTPFSLEVQCRVEPGLSVPLSVLNALRREILDALTTAITAPPEHRQYDWHPSPLPKTCSATQAEYAVSIQRWDQASDELLSLNPGRIEVPLALLQDEKNLLSVASRREVVVVLPRVLWDSQRESAIRLLHRAKAVGVTRCLCSTWGSVRLAQSLGFQALGDYGLGITNSETTVALAELGVQSVTLSFEQRLARLRDLRSQLPTQLIVYGRLPLMITENCIISNRTGGKCHRNCQSQPNLLSDRKGARFPVIQAWGCKNEILNSKVLYLADRRDYLTLGCSCYRLLFTLESPEECVSILRQYMGLEPPSCKEFTRGLYYRDVE